MQEAEGKPTILFLIEFGRFPPEHSGCFGPFGRSYLLPRPWLPWNVWLLFLLRVPPGTHPALLEREWTSSPLQSSVICVPPLREKRQSPDIHLAEFFLSTSHISFGLLAYHHLDCEHSVSSTSHPAKPAIPSYSTQPITLAHCERPATPAQQDWLATVPLRPSGFSGPSSLVACRYLLAKGSWSSNQFFPACSTHNFGCWSDGL